MDMLQVKFKNFIPNTVTINQDRKYFKSEDLKYFLKIDTNVERGVHEASMLNYLLQNNIDFVPKIFNSETYFAFGNYGPMHHNLVIENIVGETIENSIFSLNVEEKIYILKKVIEMIKIMQKINFVHGDINESNIIYNKKDNKIYLIDFERSKIINKNKNEDISGPPWGYIYLYEKMLNKKCEEYNP